MTSVEILFLLIFFCISFNLLLLLGWKIKVALKALFNKHKFFHSTVHVIFLYFFRVNQNKLSHLPYCQKAFQSFWGAHTVPQKESWQILSGNLPFCRQLSANFLQAPATFLCSSLFSLYSASFLHSRSEWLIKNNWIVRLVYLCKRPGYPPRKN